MKEIPTQSLPGIPVLLLLLAAIAVGVFVTIAGAGVDDEDSVFALLSDPPDAPVPSVGFAGFSLSDFRGPLPSLP